MRNRVREQRTQRGLSQAFAIARFFDMTAGKMSGPADEEAGT
jgi:hypothetical protein